MTLLEQFQELSSQWSGVFARKRTVTRAKGLALAHLVSLGRRTISRALCALGEQQGNWSAWYRVFSQRPWESQDLFTPVLSAALRWGDAQGPVMIAVDDTRVKKTGLKIAQASYHRDPLSPPFHLNLLRGLRLLQAAVVIPLHRNGDQAARTLPVALQCLAPPPKAKRGASLEEQQRVARERVRLRLTVQAAALLAELRRRCDVLGASSRTLLILGDGAFCNRTIFRHLPARTDLLVRARKDVRLFSLPTTARRKYGEALPLPDELRRAARDLDWHSARVHFGGQFGTMDYLEYGPLLWRGGALTLRLRLLILRPLPYTTPGGARNYRKPAYLLTTDLISPAGLLIQAYCDRWQIEVNHREEKSLLGLGQAQVWTSQAVPRHPAFVVASYSLLLLAGLHVYGPERCDQHVPLPRWRRNAKRASALDLLTLLRLQLAETPPNTRNPHASLHYAYT